MHGLSPEEEIDYWRERARMAEAERDEARADAKLGNEIAAKVNGAINRAGIHCALYFWEAIDQIAKERDEARAEAKRYRSQLEELTWIANGRKAANAWKPSAADRETLRDAAALVTIALMHCQQKGERKGAESSARILAVLDRLTQEQP